MRYTYFFCALLFLSLFTGSLHSQDLPYIIGAHPAVFSKLEDLLEREETDSVLVLCNQILQQELGDQVSGIAYFYKGQAETLVNNNTLFVREYEKALEIFKTLNFTKGLSMVYGKQAELYYFQNAYAEADSLFKLSIAYAEEVAQYEVLINALQKEAAIYTYYQQPQSVINFLKTALGYAILIKDQGRANDLINQISTNYHSDGQLDSAIVYFRKGIELKISMEDTEGLISDYSALGNLYRERGAYEAAQENLFNALKIAEAETDTFSITTIYCEIGDVYAAQKIWDDAASYYHKSLALAKLKGSKFAEAGCLKQLGNIAQIRKENPAAVTYYEAALQIYQQYNNKINAADVIVSLSQLYQEGNQFGKAKKLLREALAIRSNSENKMSTLSAKMALAEIEVLHGSLSAGMVMAKECLDFCEEINDKEGLNQMYVLLSEGYAKSGNFKKAYEFYRLYSLNNESLTSLERTKAIKNYEMLYETEKKDKEIAQQKGEIEKQKAEIQKRNNQLLLLASGLVIIVLLTILILYIYLKNKQLNFQRIQVLKKEQETQMLKSVIEGEEKERKRVARELHDGLGAVLATVKMQISGIQHKFPEIESSATYQKAELLIDEACRTVREISHNLMPNILEQQGLIFAMEDLCHTFANHHKIDFDFIPYGDEQLLPDELKITVFRITQELLKNIIKHAAAKAVIVQLTIEENEVILIVEDDGKGFDTATLQSGIGIENIRSRTAYLNGTLTLDTTIGQGTTFTIQFPLSKN